MAQKEKKFLVTVSYTDEELRYVAEQNSLSLQELTDEKLAEFLQDDLAEIIGNDVKVSLDLTPAP